MRKAESVGIPVKLIVYGNSHAVLAKSPKGQSDMFIFPIIQAPAVILWATTLRAGSLYQSRSVLMAAMGAVLGRMAAMTVAPNGKAYGINGKAIAEIDPSAWTGKKIADESGTFLAADKNNILYFARRAQLYRLK